MVAAADLELRRANLKLGPAEPSIETTLSWTVPFIDSDSDILGPGEQARVRGTDGAGTQLVAPDCRLPRPPFHP